jgi:thioredoxin 1
MEHSANRPEHHERRTWHSCLTPTERPVMHSHLQIVTDADFAARVLEADRPVVVDFWAAWCPPCRTMAPVLDALAAERPDILFVTLDADANQQTVVERQVLSMPTFLVFRDGTEILRLVGSRPKHRLAAELDEALAAAVMAAR